MDRTQGLIPRFDPTVPLNQFSGGHSEWVPPDPFSNSEVKTLSADGSVGSPHVRVGHRQDLFMKSRSPLRVAAFFMHRLWRCINVRSRAGVATHAG